VRGLSLRGSLQAGRLAACSKGALERLLSSISLAPAATDHAVAPAVPERPRAGIAGLRVSIQARQVACNDLILVQAIQVVQRRNGAEFTHALNSDRIDSTAAAASASGTSGHRKRDALTLRRKSTAFVWCS